MTTEAFLDAERAFNSFLSERAARYVRAGEDADGGRLTSLAAHAVMTGDKFLATEIMSRLGTMPIRDRKLAMLLREELESVFFGHGLAKALRVIEVARNRACRANVTEGNT